MDVVPAQAGQGWVVHSLVVAKYPTGDYLGMFFGYYSLLVYEIQAVYITLFLVNRDVLTFYCCFTHLLSEIANYTLKHVIKEPRPNHGAPGGGLFEGRYGMPSQHCHCFAYLVTMAFLLIFHYYRKHIGKAFKIITLVIGSLGLTLQVYGRLYLRYHTLNQCFGGVAFGTMSAISFYILGLLFFMPYADAICRVKLLRYFSFRKDLISEIPNNRTHGSSRLKRS